jgi:hypothetical protein
MNVNEVFPSNYLKAADLQGREIPVMIDRVEMESFGQDQKAIVYFRGKQKGVVLNKTNAMNIAGAYGDDTDGWVNQPVVLFSVWTDFQGKSVQAIRIRPGSTVMGTTRAAPPPPPAPDEMSESIPF